MPFDLAQAVPALIVVLLSLTVHEYAHAWTAHRLGDDTAARMGRLTLNPIAHVDLLGTILVPLVLALAGVPPIGWAKPVPVDPSRFRRGVKMSTGDTLVSFAGPISNLAFGLVAALALGVYARFAGPGLERDPGVLLLLTLILVNVGLAVFNLLPIPPLDGSHFVGHLLPARMQAGWDRFRTFGPLLLLALLYIRPGGRSLLTVVLHPAREFLVSLLLRVSNGVAA